MQQVDFYILQNQLSSIDFTCRLLEKIYREKLRVLVICVNEKEARLLDEKLWTYRDISFVPHQYIEYLGEEIKAPIIISKRYEEVEGFDIVINLMEEHIPKESIYPRVIEIVSNDEKVKEKARSRFAAYKAYGVDLKTNLIP